MTVHKYYQAMGINELLKAINHLKVSICSHEGFVISKITFTPVKMNLIVYYTYLAS